MPPYLDPSKKDTLHDLKNTKKIHPRAYRNSFYTVSFNTNNRS